MHKAAHGKYCCAKHRKLHALKRVKFSRMRAASARALEFYGRAAGGGTWYFAVQSTAKFTKIRGKFLVNPFPVEKGRNFLVSFSLFAQRFPPCRGKSRGFPPECTTGRGILQKGVDSAGVPPPGGSPAIFHSSLFVFSAARQ
ncbi:MAG TPA: hypothetical protein H9682_09085 [Firmicutes bacterium]|nr:hypothetical protein [Bacillota bacterium]